jgi:misacylated tRNA(Ala) deacylase
MTERLFLDDATLATATARVLASGPDCIVLDRTIFYARSGGQPGDTGLLRWDGGSIAITDTIKGDGDTILHLAAGELPPEGVDVTLELDWDRRHRLMRMHTALHLLCSLIPGAGVTGGSIGVDKSRLDFDLPNPPSKETLEAALNGRIAEDHPVAHFWVDDAVLDGDPGMVRTLSVKPPRGSGRVRLVRIGDAEVPIDLQPCGGTHVSRTADIGRMLVTKIENKGQQNRRITIVSA